MTMASCGRSSFWLPRSSCSLATTVRLRSPPLSPFVFVATVYIYMTLAFMFWIIPRRNSNGLL